MAPNKTKTHISSKNKMGKRNIKHCVNEEEKNKPQEEATKSKSPKHYFVSVQHFRFVKKAKKKTAKIYCKY